MSAGSGLTSQLGRLFRNVGLAPLSKAAPITDRTRILGRREAAKYFSVRLLKASVEPGPVKVDDSGDGNLHYVSPRIWIDATVFSLAEEETKTWKVGLVQALMASTIEHQYQRGVNGWDFPILPVNDGAIESESPWYGGHRGYAYGLRRANLSFNDNFDAHVAWRLTLKGGQADDASRLISVRRQQQFHVWVAAYDMDGDTLWILDELTWTVKLRIAVDPQKPLGRRANVEQWGVSWTPPSKPILPKVAWLGPPTANSSQRFREWQDP
eukprot:GGOE01044210.1.p1 GENE.GGOE01044210.1~~GGOE01044210.1.p1  ORF type:complete len:284 (-),score=54.77 GGOE01044210.1:201-1004(-)